MRIPYDEHAERVVLGCALAHEIPARMAMSRLTAADFHHFGHRRLFECLEALDSVPWSYDDNPRITAAVDLTDIDRRDIVDLIESRPVLVDESGSYARRVKDTADRRRVLMQLEETARLIAEGEAVDEALDKIRRDAS